MHAPVPTQVVRPLVPAVLGLDTFDGQAWATMIPFAITGSRPVGAPRRLSMSFLEINLRTYVRAPDGEPGIYFFSLDASSLLAVAGARIAYGLPYHLAAMSVHANGRRVRYASRRRLGAPAGIVAEYAIGPACPPAAPGTLDHFLIERYLLYAWKGARLRSARVAHAPYPVQPAAVSDLDETLTTAAGLPRPQGPPLAHYARMVDVRIYRPRRA